MGLIRFGTDNPERHFVKKKPHALYVPKPSVMGQTEIQGDFTKGIGQGVGIILGVIGAGWVASKIMSRSD
jgi:hypothetical protein